MKTRTENRSWPPRFRFVVMLSTLTASCGILEPDERRVIGVMETFANPVLVEVPDSVAVSVPFAVSVTTYSGFHSCVTRIGDTEVGLEGSIARVTPYDYRSERTEDRACTDILRIFEHQTTVRFDVPGEAVVVVIGRKWGVDALIEHEFPVHVF